MGNRLRVYIPTTKSFPRMGEGLLFQAEDTALYPLDLLPTDPVPKETAAPRVPFYFAWFNRYR
ncbi:MAG: hypothetical protein FD153_1275 [Rhodospirillaceae bacterium]|nr:MAG: hypothetical protein FD153_1275 [Rhodospirillaceae bacterium]